MSSAPAFCSLARVAPRPRRTCLAGRSPRRGSRRRSTGSSPRRSRVSLSYPRRSSRSAAPDRPPGARPIQPPASGPRVPHGKRDLLEQRPRARQIAAPRRNGRASASRPAWENSAVDMAFRSPWPARRPRGSAGCPPRRALGRPHRGGTQASPRARHGGCPLRRACSTARVHASLAEANARVDAHEPQERPRPGEAALIADPPEGGDRAPRLRSASAAQPSGFVRSGSTARRSCMGPRSPAVPPRPRHLPATASGAIEVAGLQEREATSASSSGALGVARGQSASPARAG